MQKFPFFLVILLVFSACRKDQAVEAESGLVVPVGFPQPVFPSDNAFSEVRLALGKRLFYDPILSKDSTRTCESCHHPHKAFSDTVAFSLGVGDLVGTRNAPSLANVAYHPYFTREGGLSTLEMQILVPIQEHNEFNFNIVRIASRMKADTSYVRMCAEAYSREPDAFCITRAIATFERTLISGNSRFDAYAFQGISSALNPAERRGMALFFSAKTNCSTCHGGFNFTNYAFENNGLYAKYADPGRYRLTGDSMDIARFKVPSLRNVAVTGPYMHDGSLASLQDVVNHYDSGGHPHPQRSGLVRTLGLSTSEKADLVTFLESLTDEAFLTNKKLRQ